MTPRADVALGSNLGDRAAWLASARAALSLLPGTRILAASSIEETIPFGPAAQGPYLNQMLALESVLAPIAMLHALQAIERRLGRIRRERWGARVIDLDLVRLGTVTMHSSRLVLPHPGLPHRAFWQRELSELDRMLDRAA
ncbi:MAG TPA: 2-amino-4-hydroxy-6-hydroxymethyldihydropteridine diphosphokinase [Gemmatimonadaceae bacterium]|nr:2-amino-4-hydroxy-6-hydroxymethyldihydropteridine diphosphokinase [Gemmatimonadaceae bacterium]